MLVILTVFVKDYQIQQPSSQSISPKPQKSNLKKEPKSAPKKAEAKPKEEAKTAPKEEIVTKTKTETESKSNDRQPKIPKGAEIPSNIKSNST